jgi:hypothetical protein
MPTSTYTPIATTNLGTSQSSVTFNSFSGYTDLVLVVNATTATAGQGINLQFNGDTGSNYSSTRLYGNGSSASSDRQSNGTFINFALGEFTAGQLIIANIQNYSNSTTYKSLLLRQNTASTYVGALAGLWRSTSAITSMTLTVSGFASFTAGSTFTLYGIKAA